MNSPSSSTREIEIRKKMVDNRTVVQQGLKMSWHPHPTICLLRWWVSEGESARIRWESAFWSCVLDRTERDTASIVRRNERLKKFERSWRPTKGRTRTKGTVEERHRCTDDQKEYSRVWANDRNCEWYLTREEWLFCPTRQFFKDIVLFGGAIPQFHTSNQQQSKSTFIQRSREIEIDSMNHHSRVLAPHLSVTRIHFLCPICVSLSSLNVSLLIKLEDLGFSRLFLIGKRLEIRYTSAIKISWHPQHAIYHCELRD